MNINIGGITVIFPYKPYDIQIKYMSCVIDALQNKHNALLESPTGTGKTLSLLCSTLAWLDHKKFEDLDLKLKGIQPKEKLASAENLIVSDNDSGGKNDKKAWKTENAMRIIYCSRTHSQLSQACLELKNTYYRYCPTVTIGSRDQLCINPDVANLEVKAAKNQTCHQKVKNNLCIYHHNYERKISEIRMTDSKVFDIEDLMKFGNEHKACPYYLSKSMKDSTLIFMPYNYVLDPNIRKTFKMNLENSVIIFDEGHNIEQVCEDSMSTEIKSELLALCIKTLDTTLTCLNQLTEGKYEGINDKELSELKIHDVAKVKLTICDLEVELDTLAKSVKNGAHDTGEIFKIMQKIGLDFSRYQLISSVVEKMSSFIMNSNSFMTNQTLAALSSVCSFLEVIFPFTNIKNDEFIQYKKNFIKNYKLYTETEQENNYKKTWLKTDNVTGWIVHLWCMSPSVAIKSLQKCGIHNLIITSGTLSPLESFEFEMDIRFLTKLQNSHVINQNQLSIQIIPKDPNGNELCGSFEKRKDSKFYYGLGLSIIELARNIPKGIFIFFSSYSLINRCIEEWKDGRSINIWNSICSLKKVFIEPKNKNEFNANMQSFKQIVDHTADGAIFMAVCRGKLSEGIDLADDYCRAVIMIGLPYPARYDPRVVLKQQYLNENVSKLNGTKWYILQMKRALNQSIGRVVRHKNDYGMIILCDSRFTQLNDGFSKWIMPFFEKNTGQFEFRNCIKQINTFFKMPNHIELPPVEKKMNQNLKIESKSNMDTKPAPNNELVDYFNSMKNNFTAINNNNPMPKKPISSCQSVFETFDHLSDETNKRKFVDNNNSAKKIRTFLNEDSFLNKTKSNDKSKLISNYFQSNSFPVDTKLIEVDNQSNVEDGNIENCIPNKNTFLSSEEVILIKNNFLKTEQNKKTFDIIINEIFHQPIKCKQLMETLQIFYRKRNSTYLALRLNFILDIVEDQKRVSILKDLSLLIPERERKHFLRVCKVEHF